MIASALNCCTFVLIMFSILKGLKKVNELKFNFSLMFFLLFFVSEMGGLIIIFKLRDH